MEMDYRMFPTYILCRFGDFNTPYDAAKIVLFGCPLYYKSVNARPFINPVAYLRLFSYHIEDKSILYPNRFYSEVRCIDIGDILSRNLDDVMTDMSSLVNKVVSKDSKKILMIGGDHLNTYLLVKAIQPENLIVFDAHLDAKDIYCYDKLNHATFIRRLLEEDAINKLVIIGYRAYSSEEISFLKQYSNVVLISRDDLYRVTAGGNAVGCETSLSDILARVLYRGSTYVSIDLDVLDPMLMPHVTTPEPLGINLSDIINVLRILIKLRENGLSLIAGDVVEYMPYDLNPNPPLIACKLIFETLMLLSIS